MIRFEKQEEGLLGAFDRNAKLDWAKLQAEITELFGETRQTLARYIPVEPTDGDDAEDSEQDEYDWDSVLSDERSVNGDDLDDACFADIATNYDMTDTDA